MKTDVQVGQYDFDGNCMPRSGTVHVGWETFSVGVFQWVPRSNLKEGIKRGPVKVRVKGPTSRPEKVLARAREVADQLDRGVYQGPKTVTVR